jgi:hypothetical protein
LVVLAPLTLVAQVPLVSVDPAVLLEAPLALAPLVLVHPGPLALVAPAPLV